MPLRPEWLIVIAVLAAVAVAVALYAALPWLVRPLFRLMLAPRYRLRVTGLEHLPRKGPALLAVNHVTWLDGFFLVAICPRRGRALVNADYVNLPILRSVARRSGLIAVPNKGPRGHRAVISAVQDALDRGEAVAIFPEAQLSRNGLTGPFLRGLELMVAHRPDVPVIPIFLDNLWCSNFSFSGGHFFRKRPRGLRHVVCAAFGPPVEPPITAFRVRQAVLAAGVQAFAMRPESAKPLETLDPTLPRYEHPTLGLLTASTPDVDDRGVKQTGHKPATLGQSVPGVALRIVDESGQPLPPDTEGCLQALLSQQPEWVDTRRRGRLDSDGFLSLSEA